MNEGYLASVRAGWDLELLPCQLMRQYLCLKVTYFLKLERLIGVHMNRVEEPAFSTVVLPTISLLYYWQSRFVSYLCVNIAPLHNASHVHRLSHGSVANQRFVVILFELVDS